MIVITELRVMAPYPIVSFIWSQRNNASEKEFYEECGNPQVSQSPQRILKSRELDFFGFAQVTGNPFINPIVDHINCATITKVDG